MQLNVPLAQKSKAHRAKKGTALLGGSIQIGMIGTPGLINAAVAT
jgi:hypothetical protein